MNAKHESIYKKYSEYLLIKGFATTTVNVYSKEAKKLLEYVDDIEYITRQIAIEYISKYSHLSKASRNMHAVALKSFTTYLKKNVYFSMNEIKIPHIKITRNLPEILEPTELFRRLDVVKNLSLSSQDWIDKRNYALIILMYATGMRVSEALSFKLSDINENDWVLIENGKGSKERYVPIVKSAIDALKEYKKICPFSLDKNFFVMYQGKPLTRISVYNMLKRTMGLSPHSMRHHYATHMIMNGSDVNVVSELLGHSNLITTQIYTHIKKPQLAVTLSECHPMAQGGDYDFK